MAIYCCEKNAKVKNGFDYIGPCHCCDNEVRYNVEGPEVVVGDFTRERDLFAERTDANGGTYNHFVAVKTSGVYNGAVSWRYVCRHCFWLKSF